MLLAAGSSWLRLVFIPIAVGAIPGLLNGLVIAYGGVVPFMATLAMLVAARGLAELVGNRQTLIVNSNEFKGRIFAIVAVAAWFLLSRTTFGRRTVIIVVAVLLQQRFAARDSRQT